MLDQVLSVFHVEPDYDLSIMKPGQTLFDVTCDVLSGMKAVLEVLIAPFLLHRSTLHCYSAPWQTAT